MTLNVYTQTTQSTQLLNYFLFNLELQVQGAWFKNLVASIACKVKNKLLHAAN